MIVFPDNIFPPVFRDRSWNQEGAVADQQFRFTGERDVELESALVGTRVTPDRAGLKVWPAHGWVQRLTMARPHGR